MNGMILGIAGFSLVLGATLMWFRAARAVQLPEDRRGYLAAWLGGAALGAAAFAAGPGILGGAAAGLALAGGAMLSVLVAISRQEVASDAIRVGERLREFTAPNDEGRPFELASVSGGPVLLKFFRGHW